MVPSGIHTPIFVPCGRLGDAEPNRAGRPATIRRLLAITGPVASPGRCVSSRNAERLPRGSECKERTSIVQHEVAMGVLCVRNA
jgi:hypothetical protein